MTKRVNLRFDGTLEAGFQVTLEIGEDQLLSFSDATGTLPPSPALAAGLYEWQQHYRQLAVPTRIALQQITIRPGAAVHLQVCRQLAEDLQQCFKTWLGSPSFQAVETRLCESVDRTEPVRVLLRTTDRRLHRLPWHRWDCIDRYPQAEVALSTPPARAIEPSCKVDKVRILAILGDRRGIDTDRDRAILTALPNAAVLFLVEPSRQQLDQQLWDQTWDILFFAGHSHTEASQGHLHINPADSLTIAELKYGLRQAIARGLQLAIFNSCDGLGLAYELETLHLSQLIVMREPVPDPVAQEFLKHFLTAFAQGKALYPAVREARERLQGLEGQYPCATWLPIICQNPAVTPPSWQSLQGGRKGDQDGRAVAAQAQSLNRSTEAHDRLNVKIPSFPHSLLLPLLTSLAITGIVWGARFMGLLQPLEMAAFDHWCKCVLLNPQIPACWWC